MSLGMLANMDRRWIFVALFATVIGVQLAPVGDTDVAVTKESKSLFEAIEGLKEGDPLLISFDFDPGSKPELYPAARSVLKHAFEKKLRIVTMGLWVSGTGLAATIVQDVAAEHYGSREEAEKHYGTDYVFLGWRPGLFAVIIELGEGIQATYDTEFYGRSTNDLPVLQGVDKLKDFELVVTLSAGSPGMEDWIQFGQGKYGIKLGGAVTAVAAPGMLTFFKSGQLSGLLSGMKGAAEYEKLMKNPGYAHLGLKSLNWLHMLVIVLILFSNVVYFLSKRT